MISFHNQWIFMYDLLVLNVYLYYVINVKVKNMNAYKLDKK